MSVSRMQIGSKLFKHVAFVFALLGAIAIISAFALKFAHWSAERNAVSVCRSYSVGTKFIPVSIFADKLRQRNRNHYGYTFLSGYAEAFSCNIYVDDSDAIIAVHVLRSDGEIEKILDP